jgi:predicted Na+-dependent transporter
MGISLGYFSASIFRLKHSIRRTIAIEAGIQNVGTALAIISLSFPFEVYFMIITFTVIVITKYCLRYILSASVRNY